MFGGESDDALEIALPIGNGLSRDGEDEVERQVVEACAASGRQRFQRITGSMNPTECGEVAIVETLCADAQAIDAGLA